MNRFIITAAALLFSTSALAETSAGATSKVISLGGHYTIHSVAADGTITVKTVTGDDAAVAVSNAAALAALVNSGR